MSAPTRTAAVIAWAAVLVAPLSFAAVTLAAATPAQVRTPELAGLFFWLSAAVVGLGIVLSRTLPRRLASRAAASPDAVAFTRLVAAWGILEGAALFPLVARLVTGDAFLLLLTAVALAALAALFPSPARWAEYAVRPLRGGGADGEAR